MRLRRRSSVAQSCVCGQPHARVLTCDAATSRRDWSDPTGTLKLRKSLDRDLDRRWLTLRQSIAAQVGKVDILGLSAATTGPQVVQSAEERLKLGQAWVDESLRQSVIGYDDGAWLSRAVAGAYALGVQRASRATKKLAAVDYESAALHGAAAVAELQGVAEAVSQQVVRVMVAAMVTRILPQSAARAAQDVVQKVGVLRGKMVVSMSVVRAYGEGTLDALQSLGVRRVAVAPEHLAAAPQLTVGDAKFTRDDNPNQPRNRLGQFRPYARPPSRQQFSRARMAEERLGRLGQVNVLTAGDDDVCPTCEAIADGGPYDIDEARGLIPAHPRCRCAFDPVDEDVDTDVEE